MGKCQKELKKQLDQAVAETTKMLQAEDGKNEQLMAGQYDGEKNVLQTKIESLEKLVILMKDTHWNMEPDKAKAIMLAKRQLPEFVYDAVNLEGIDFTLPEVQTLLDGITVGGHKVSDQQIALNQADTWRHLFALIENNQFEITAETACALHRIAARDEALEWGMFRSGGVTIAGTDYMPPPADTLPELFEKMIEEASRISDVYDRAIHFFLTMARCQFFYDVNKRMGRFIMNGLLLNEGYPAINLPARKQLEFNQLMLPFYETGNQEQMNIFLRSCLDEKVIKIMKEEPLSRPGTS